MQFRLVDDQSNRWTDYLSDTWTGPVLTADLYPPRLHPYRHKNVTSPPVEPPDLPDIHSAAPALCYCVFPSS